ncbi:unnamed protein product [Ectocarpus sp. 12 AP-2014]
MAGDGPSVLEEQPVSAEEAIALIDKAKTIVEADMGVKAADMLGPDFRFLWQFNGDMGRADYLTEGTGPYATLRTALPDLFWNSYDYRVDKYNRNRVWATTRLTGTHNGPLVFDGKEYPPSGIRVEAAPECVSVTFDEKSGLAAKITGGFCIDRGVGNTGPAGGIWGVLQARRAIGEPVSAWKYFPPVKVVADVLGPTFRPKGSQGKAKAPFRDSIAIALAKQVLTALRDDTGALADLLADDCMIYAPILGPLKKKEIIQSATVDLVDFFSGLDTDDNLHDARVDPFEPSRVWITTIPTTKVVGPTTCFGTKFEPKRQSFVSTPQTFSVTFDADGFASKITLGCPMDTEVGDTDGLTNFQGILAGLGIPLPDPFGRPVPDSFRRVLSSVFPKKKPAPPAVKKPAPAKPAAAKPAAPVKKTAPPAAKAGAKKAAPARPVAKPGMLNMPTAMPAKKTAPPAKKKPVPAKPAAKKPAMLKKPAMPPAKKPAPAAAKPAASKPTAAPKAKPATPPKKAAAPAAAAASKAPAAAKSGGGSTFGGMFNFGSGGSRGGGAGGAKRETAATKAKKEAPKPVAPKKVAAPKEVAAPKKATAPAAAAASKAPAAAKSGGGSPFGGMFNFGGGGSGGGGAGGAEKDKKEAVATKAKKGAPKPVAPKKVAAPKKAAVPKKAAPPKKAAAPVKQAKPAPAVAKATGSVTFSPALAQKLEEALGSASKVDQLSKRTELFARGGISAMDYWSTLKNTLGPDGVQNLGPDIIGALPSGNQKSAIFKLYSTS